LTRCSLGLPSSRGRFAVSPRRGQRMATPLTSAKHSFPSLRLSPSTRYPQGSKLLTRWVQPPSRPCSSCTSSQPEWCRLINNAIVGMAEGSSVPPSPVGVGYRTASEDDPRGTEKGGNGKRLDIKFGFSHSIFVPISPHIKAEVPAATKIILSRTYKHQLGLFVAKVRK
jgi:hypothetical protein